MKLYELTFVDIEEGTIRRWETNKRGAAALVRKWKKQHPLRRLVLMEPITVPDDKKNFVAWLNRTANNSR